MNKQLYKVYFDAELNKQIYYNCEFVITDSLKSAIGIAEYLCERQYPKTKGFINHSHKIDELTEQQLTSVYNILSFLNEKIIDESELDLEVWGELFKED